MTTDGSPPDGVEVLGPDPDLVAGSAILEKAAHQAAVPVQRLSETLVLCDTASGGVIFYGLTGQTCGRSAEVLCSNDAWLREYLADRGLPVVASRLLDVAAGETVESTAAALGFPLQLRPALASQPKFEVDGPDALSQAWRSVVEMLPPRAQILLERASQGSELSLAVVAGRVVASAPDLQPSPVKAHRLEDDKGNQDHSEHTDFQPRHRHAASERRRPHRRRRHTRWHRIRRRRRRVG